ncbi:MAG TPA: hypothetical protein VHO48_03950, partial [Anaerolineaceae bacterium]|nr:hypothetical protein [Anaerolineaceae bacterium]
GVEFSMEPTNVGTTTAAVLHDPCGNLIQIYQLNDTLLQTIRSQILTLPDETRLFPGHGSETMVGIEREYNPFLA